MRAWKTTEEIFKFKFGNNVFENNWFNEKNPLQSCPPFIEWTNERPIRFEDVDLWEIITEINGITGVYASYMPYAEYYIVTHSGQIVAEFEGYMANERAEKFLIENNIQYPKTNNSPTQNWQKQFNKKFILL